MNPTQLVSEEVDETSPHTAMMNRHRAFEIQHFEGMMENRKKNKPLSALHLDAMYAHKAAHEAHKAAHESTGRPFYHEAALSAKDSSLDAKEASKRVYHATHQPTGIDPLAESANPGPIKISPVSQLHTVRYININGTKTPYISYYTQAYERLHGLTEEVREARCLYPHSVETSPIKLTRDQLPQVDGNRLLEDCSDKGIIVEHITQKPSTLQPTQSEFNEEKVLNMMNEHGVGPECCMPIITTRDNFIIDGHHRWLSHYNMGDSSVRCAQVNLNVQQMFEMLDEANYVEYRGLNESQTLALGCIIESLDAGKELEVAVAEAMEVCNMTEEQIAESVTALMEAAKTKKSAQPPIKFEYPIITIRRIARNAQPGTVTFKDGKRLRVDHETASAIAHVHHHLSDANKRRIEHGIAKNKHNFDRIADWSSVHASALMEGAGKITKEKLDILFNQLTDQATEWEEQAQKDAMKKDPKTADSKMNVDQTGNSKSPVMINPQMDQGTTGLAY